MRPRSEAPARILEAAIGVITSGGEVAIRVHELANACGVTGPILYRAFGSREGLIEAAQLERYRRTLLPLDQFVEALRSCGQNDEFRATVICAASSAVEDRENRRIRANIIGSSTTRPNLASAITGLRNTMIERIADALAHAQRAGCLRADLDVAAAASWWLAQVDSRVHVELAPSTVDNDRWDSIARDALGAVLFGDSPVAV